MVDHAVVYLSADVVALTGASESYLSFLIRARIITPLKHRNGKTNLFTGADVERVRWAVANRGRLSLEAMRAACLSAVPA